MENCKNCQDEIFMFVADSLINDGFCTEFCRIEYEENLFYSQHGSYIDLAGKERWAAVGESIKNGTPIVKYPPAPMPNYSILSLEELQKLRDKACDWLRLNMDHLRFEEANKRYMKIEDEIMAKETAEIMGVK